MTGELAYKFKPFAQLTPPLLTLMKDFPVAARLYVVAVCVAGAVVAALNAPHSLNKPGLFFALLVCSSVASALKVSLPLATHGSTMSISTQSTSRRCCCSAPTRRCGRRDERVEPVHIPQQIARPYRTLFSMASLILTVKLAGLVYAWFGGPLPTRPLDR